MSKIANDGFTRSGIGCFIAVPILQQWASKGLNLFYIVIARPLLSLTERGTGRPILFSFRLSVRLRVRKFGIF